MRLSKKTGSRLYLRITIAILLFTTSVIAANGASTLLIKHADSQLLIGDKSRAYLDVNKIQVSTSGEATQIRITTRDRFPSPEHMVGMGFTMNIDFFTQRVLPPAEPELRIQLSYDSDGWKDSLSGTSLSLENSQRSIALEMEVFNNEIIVQLPTVLLVGANQMSVWLTTEDFPKWVPITQHPMIMLELPQTEAKQMKH